MQELQTSLAGTFGFPVFLTCVSPSIAGGCVDVQNLTNADVPYYLGNFNVPFVRDKFDESDKREKALLALEMFRVFGMLSPMRRHNKETT